MKGLIFFIILIFSTNVFASQEIKKTDSVIEVLNATNKVYKLAKNNNQMDQSYVRQKLIEIINGLSSLDQLSTFAVISRNIAYPGNAGDENFDQWFQEAFWISIEKIACNRTKEKDYVLQAIKQRIFLDGGDKLRFDLFTRQEVQSNSDIQ